MDSKQTITSGLLGTSPPLAPPDDDHIPLYTSKSPGDHPARHSDQGLIHAMKPPPVAMSLRTRESSALSLKHIFDQISNGSSTRVQDYKSNQEQQFGGFQGMRNQSCMPDLRKRLPKLDLTLIRNARETSPSIAHAQTGFGSPISTPMPANQTVLSHWSGPMNGRLCQHSYPPQPRPSLRPNLSSSQSTAQMTIFYSGNVNVYDDIPTDKAHAIMLLAGNSWSTNFTGPVPPTAISLSSLPHCLSTDTTKMKERDTSPVKATPLSIPNVTTTLKISSVRRMKQNFASPAAPGLSPLTTSASLITAPPPSPASSPLTDTIRIPQSGAAAAKRSHAGIELPHARKASLARFLEKRKDRVQVQQLNPDEEAGGLVEEKGGGSCSGKPDHDTP